MAVSVIRLINDISTWMTFAVGATFNAVLVGLIVRHTPQQMRIFSRILLQTCFTDLAAVLTTALFNPISAIWTALLELVIYFISAKGYASAWNNGLMQVQDPTDQVYAVLGNIVWSFFVYVSLFGFVSQFIYRYLTLNWGRRVSLPAYFAIFLAVLCVPSLYVVIAAFTFYPPEGHEFLDDAFAAEQLQLNISDHIVLAAAQPPTSSIGKYLFYYIWASCALAYLLTLTLGWLMHRYVKTRFMGASDSHKKEMQNQIAKTLTIQASLPLLIFIPLQFGITTILLGINTSVWKWMPYYYMYVHIPMITPPALNPLVAILSIREYRKAFFAPIMRALGKHNGASSTVILVTHVQTAGPAERGVSRNRNVNGGRTRIF